MDTEQMGQNTINRRKKAGRVHDALKGSEKKKAESIGDYYNPISSSIFHLSSSFEVEG